MSLTDQKSTTLTRLRVQPINKPASDALFKIPLYPSLIQPKAVTFLGLYTATVASDSVINAGAVGNITLDAIPQGSSLADGNYFAIPQQIFGALVAAGFALFMVGFSTPHLVFSVISPTAANITVTAGTTISFLLIRTEA
jgi:hypothetical protein